MKVLLVIPPSTLKERYGDLLEAGAVYPSMGLAFIAAVALENGHEVMVIDAEADQLDYDAIKSRVVAFQPQVVGFQTFCANLARCRKVASIVKSLNPDIQIVFGGVQATLFPEEQLRDSPVDIVVIGEGEIAFSELLSCIESGGKLADVEGIAIINESGEFVVTQRPPLISSLDDLPFPALHLFPMDKYHSSAQLKGSNTQLLFTSRGCPFNCSYCSGDLIFGKTFRYRSPAKVIADIRYMMESFGVDSIQFYDETFTVNRDRVLALCDALINADLSIPWACFTRVDLVDEDLLSQMRQAGCYQIFFGVETGVDRLLKLIRKGTTLDQARKTFKVCRKLGIETVASFMLTLPTETREDTEQSIRFGLELDPDYVYWLTFVPYPGNELSDLARESGTIINDDPTTYNVFNEIVYLPEGRNEKEIRKTIARAYRRFYLRPRYMVRQVRKLLQLPPKKAFILIKGGLRTLLKKEV
ncbi:cobalamin-dependent protein [bacterium]|nr:cobalamin-dependent protein [candidate division CSSED10-310 bacterium]